MNPHIVFKLLGFDHSEEWLEFVSKQVQADAMLGDPIARHVDMLITMYKQPTYNPESWLFKTDNDIQHTQATIIAKYPELTTGGSTEPWAMRKLLAWVERVDLLKDDDDKLGAYNWSYTAKHIAERAIKMYVSNSQMILAAIMCGYLPNYVRQTNCDFKKGWWYEQ